jgi:hypothetical protein
VQRAAQGVLGKPVQQALYIHARMRELLSDMVAD